MAKTVHEEIALSKLLLDNENPRHDPIDNEAEIIAQLIKREKVLALARAIAERKETSPLENIGVLAHPTARGQYLVVEGNRRVCALKLLKDPEKAPTMAQRRQLKALKAKIGKVPESVHVVRFTDEADADYWKGLRHQGEQGGIGVRAWGSEEKTRFALKGKGARTSNELAIQLRDHALERKLITQAEHDAIAVTTLTRYLSNPVLRDAIGLASPTELLIQAPAAEFEHAVQVFLKDAVPRKGEQAPVHSRTDSKARAAYAADLRRKGHATKTRLAAPVTPKAAAAAEATKGKGRHSRGADKRPKVVPSDFRYTIRNRILLRLFEELRTIDPDDHSFAAAYLFRAFLEQLVHQYATDHGCGINGELHLVIGRVLAHMDKQNKYGEKVLSPLRTAFNAQDSRLSPRTLGKWVHASEVPTGAEIKRRWDTYEAAFRAMLEALK